MKRKLNYKTIKIIFIFILFILVVVFIYKSNNKSIKLEAKCFTEGDCKELDCRGAGKGKLFCDYNGFPACSDNRCVCALTCT